MMIFIVIVLVAKYAKEKGGERERREKDERQDDG